jgi:hypothetical protein
MPEMCHQIQVYPIRALRVFQYAILDTLATQAHDSVESSSRARRRVRRDHALRVHGPTRNTHCTSGRCETARASMPTAHII